MLDRTAQAQRNNLLASVIDVVGVSLLANLLVSLVTVEDLRFVAVSIIDTSNAVLPGCPHEAVPLGQEHVLGLERLILVELRTHILDLLASLTRHSESWGLRLHIVESPARLIELGDLLDL